MIKLIFITVILGMVFSSVGTICERACNKFIDRIELRRSKKLMDEIEKFSEQNR
jgi:hypothetical protein